jgi:hypothetical protein
MPEKEAGLEKQVWWRKKSLIVFGDLLAVTMKNSFLWDIISRNPAKGQTTLHAGFLLRLLFDLDDEGDTLLQYVC